MGKVKTIEQYVQDIKETDELIQMYPDSETLRRKLYTKVSAWAKLLEITIFQSPQEKYPWTGEELGHSVKLMHTKKDTGADQTGDYMAYCRGGGYSGWIPIVVERKGARGKGGADDLYQTLSNTESREKFYRVIDRFKADKRFFQMFLIAECTLDEYLKFVPTFSGYKTRNKSHVSASVASRQATIAGLYLRGCTVIFAGNRARAIQMYLDLNRQWLLHNWMFVLKLRTQTGDIERAGSILEV